MSRTIRALIIALALFAYGAVDEQTYATGHHLAAWGLFACLLVLVACYAAVDR